MASFPGQPWHFFVYEAAFLGSRVNHPMLVAWEESLVQISDALPEVVYHVQTVNSYHERLQNWLTRGLRGVATIDPAL